MTRDEFGRKVREVRTARGWSQPEMAKAVGYGQTTLSYIENGDPQASLTSLKKVAAALNLEVDFSNHAAGIHPAGSRKKKSSLPPAKLKKWLFTPGKKYYLNGKKFKFLRKVGPHHLFQNSAGKWLSSWTDVQLIDVEVDVKP